jgi:aryl-alcohol dehydrogenase-like predicted oxidoreductase
MQMGWIVSEEDSFKLLDAALEAGITTLDTADIYSKWGDGSYAGKSEEILGRWIKDRGNRDDLILATKVRGEMSEKPNDAGLSRAHILNSADRSLDRLQTEWIDLYQSHWFDSDVTQEETLRAYTKLIDDGVINYVGASNFTDSWNRFGSAIRTGLQDMIRCSLPTVWQEDGTTRNISNQSSLSMSLA